MQDWRIYNENFFRGLKFYKIKFPDFWKNSFKNKDAFYKTVHDYIIDYIKQTHSEANCLEETKACMIWHAHCDLCTKEICPNQDTECFCTDDYFIWICKDCFDDFCNFFDWKIERERKTIRFFYRVIYQKTNEESIFDLGVFSSLKNAREKIAQASCQIGFKDWVNGFQVIKFGVNFEKNIKINKHGLKLFSISHEYEIEEDETIYDIYKYFGVFPSLEQAERRVNFLKRHTHCGKKYPNAFEISEVIVDNYSAWSEGFTSF